MDSEIVALHLDCNDTFYEKDYKRLTRGKPGLLI